MLDFSLIYSSGLFRFHHQISNGWIMVNKSSGSGFSYTQQCTQRYTIAAWSHVILHIFPMLHQNMYNKQLIMYERNYRSTCDEFILCPNLRAVHACTVISVHAYTYMC